MTAVAPVPEEAPRVLVVDDEEDLRDLVSFNMRSAGFEVDSVATGREALATVRNRRPAVVVLDLMLPDMLGTAVCAALRHDPAVSDVAVIILTARGSDYDRVEGLEAGADDYLVKPFNVRELVLRVRALARRSGGGQAARGAARVLRWRGLEIETASHRVTLDGVPLTLRPLEYKLLTTLVSSPGEIFSRGDLMRHVWGTEEDPYSRTVDTHVRRLRERLGPYGDALETVHRFGYRWLEEKGAT